MSRRLLTGSSLLVLWGVSCARESPPDPGSARGAAVTPHEGTAADVLDSIDGRAPIPLTPMMANHQKENMRDHLLAVQTIVAALAIGDFEEVERAASRIGSSESMGQQCQHMGAGAPGFTALALEFHDTADRIVGAARDRDRGKVLAMLGETLARCTTCHAAWKQQVVHEETWQRKVARLDADMGARP